MNLKQIAASVPTSSQSAEMEAAMPDTTNANNLLLRLADFGGKDGRTTSDHFSRTPDHFSHLHWTIFPL